MFRDGVVDSAVNTWPSGIDAEELKGAGDQGKYEEAEAMNQRALDGREVLELQSALYPKQSYMGYCVLSYSSFAFGLQRPHKHLVPRRR